MKSKMRNIITVSIVLCVVLIVMFNTYSPEGVIGMPGFPHGIALCSKDKDFEIHEFLSFYGERAYTWRKDNVEYIVNYGHLNDPKVNKLKYLATQHCAQYR